MTAVAASPTHCSGQLAQMSVPVTIPAFPETSNPHRSSRSMTLVALHTDMPRNECESSAVMIQPTRGDLPPRGRRVAAVAVGPQPPFVGVSVAVGTALESEPGESELIDLNRSLGAGSRQMALDAGDLDVTTGEGELGSVVIESSSRLPALQGMARLTAVSRELGLVHILVAGDTAPPFQAQVGPR